MPSNNTVVATQPDICSKGLRHHQITTYVAKHWRHNRSPILVASNAPHRILKRQRIPNTNNLKHYPPITYRYFKCRRLAPCPTISKPHPMTQYGLCNTHSFNEFMFRQWLGLGLHDMSRRTLGRHFKPCKWGVLSHFIRSLPTLDNTTMDLCTGAIGKEHVEWTLNYLGVVSNFNVGKDYKSNEHNPSHERSWINEFIFESKFTTNKDRAKCFVIGLQQVDDVWFTWVTDILGVVYFR